MTKQPPKPEPPKNVKISTRTDNGGLIAIIGLIAWVFACVLLTVFVVNNSSLSLTLASVFAVISGVCVVCVEVIIWWKIRL